MNTAQLPRSIRFLGRLMVRESIPIDLDSKWTHRYGSSKPGGAFAFLFGESAGWLGRASLRGVKRDLPSVAGRGLRETGQALRSQLIAVSDELGKLDLDLNQTPYLDSRAVLVANSEEMPYQRLRFLGQVLNRSTPNEEAWSSTGQPLLRFFKTLDGTWCARASVGDLVMKLGIGPSPLEAGECLREKLLRLRSDMGDLQLRPTLTGSQNPAVADLLVRLEKAETMAKRASHLEARLEVAEELLVDVSAQCRRWLQEADVWEKEEKEEPGPSTEIIENWVFIQRRCEEQLGKLLKQSESYRKTLCIMDRQELALALGDLKVRGVLDRSHNQRTQELWKRVDELLGRAS